MTTGKNPEQAPPLSELIERVRISEHRYAVTATESSEQEAALEAEPMDQPWRDLIAVPAHSARDALEALDFLIENDGIRDMKTTSLAGVTFSSLTYAIREYLDGAVREEFDRARPLKLVKFERDPG